MPVIQAYLETDPSARVTKDEYVMRYQRFARDDLERALQKYDALHSTMGALFLQAQLEKDLHHRGSCLTVLGFGPGQLVCKC